MSKSISPNIRFKGYISAWEQRKVSDITTSYSGGTPQAGNAEYYNGDIPFIRSGEIYDDHTELFITQKGMDNSSAKMVSKGDILYALYGATSGEVSRAGLDGAINQAILAIIPNENYNADFIVEWFRKEKTNIIDKYLQGGQGNLSAQIIKNLDISIPSCEEQNMIGDFFSDINNLITLHQHKYQIFQKIKSSMLEKMFPHDGKNTPELRFVGFTGAWKQRKLGDMGTSFTGLSGKTKDDFGHGGAKFVTYMNVFTNPVSDSNDVEAVEIDNSQNAIQYGDIFFTTSSETPEEVGMSSVWLEKTDNTYLNSFCFGYRPTEKNDPYYMAYMLRSEAVRKKIIYLAQGISRYNISKNGLMQIEVPLPDISEQHAIGRYFENLDNLINFENDYINKLKTIKQAFLEKMFARVEA